MVWYGMVWYGMVWYGICTWFSCHFGLNLKVRASQCILGVNHSITTQCISGVSHFNRDSLYVRQFMSWRQKATSNWFFFIVFFSSIWSSLAVPRKSLEVLAGLWVYVTSLCTARIAEIGAVITGAIQAVYMQAKDDTAIQARIHYHTMYTLVRINWIKGTC